MTDLQLKSLKGKLEEAEEYRKFLISVKAEMTSKVADSLLNRVKGYNSDYGNWKVKYEYDLNDKTSMKCFTYKVAEIVDALMSDLKKRLKEDEE